MLKPEDKDLLAAGIKRLDHVLQNMDKMSLEDIFIDINNAFFCIRGMSIYKTPFNPTGREFKPNER
jgi:hypothetical protein